MKTMVFFLEGPSEKEMLLGLLPKLLPADMDVRYLVFRGKQDLEKNLVRRLRGWQLPDTVFVILRDQDAGDCHHVKAELVEKCTESGKTGWLVRVACRETGGSGRESAGRIGHRWVLCRAYFMTYRPV